VGAQQGQPLVLHPTTVSGVLITLDKWHQRCADNGLVPLFHYTDPGVVPYILESGLRMSTQGQGDGGVYFSTRSPASYDVGQQGYEVNVIKDCFGVERVEEFKGKHRLDAVIGYACHPWCLSAAPGGRRHAKVVTKSDFQDLSLPHDDGSFFLRPDRILGVVIVDGHGSSTSRALRSAVGSKDLVVTPLLQRGKLRDQQLFEYLENVAEVQNGIFVDVIERSAVLVGRESDGASDDEGDEEKAHMADLASGGSGVEMTSSRFAGSGGARGRMSSDTSAIYNRFSSSSKSKADDLTRRRIARATSTLSLPTASSTRNPVAPVVVAAAADVAATPTLPLFPCPEKKEDSSIATTTGSRHEEEKEATYDTQPLLPPGWSEHLHESSGKTYYSNTATGEASWEKSPFPLVPASSPSFQFTRTPNHTPDTQGRDRATTAAILTNFAGDTGEVSAASFSEL